MGRIAVTTGSLTFNTANMRVNGSYEMMVIVTKATRRSIAKILIDIVDGTTPSVTIRWD